MSFVPLLQLVQEQNEEWRRAGVDLNAVVNVQRSFSDVSSSAVFVDAVKMVGGYLLMFAYTTLWDAMLPDRSPN